MRRGHIIGRTTLPAYPIATVAGWMAIGAQIAMTEGGRVGDLVREGHSWNARKLWSLAEARGLVLQ